MSRQTHTQRVEQLATQFEAVNDDVVAIVTGCTDEQWRQVTASEGWQIGVVAHHIAEVQVAFARMVERLATGETYSPTISMDAIHESNAQHARDYADVGKPETLDPLQTSAAAILRSLRGFDDEQLDRTAGVFGENDMSVAQVLEWVVIGHAAEHLASIRATIAD